jgi:hypothetical protein
MKIYTQWLLAFLLAFLTGLAPASAGATGRNGAPHPHQQSYHDRTPKANTHDAHPHKG